jgi:hypothetical protein
MNHRAIQTEYKGYRFRSRLEARWAVFFDTLGVRYEYEKEGFELEDVGRYLPDFWLPDLNLWLEIKGVEPTWDEIRKAQELYYLSDGPTRWAVAIGVGEPYFGDLQVFCHDSTGADSGTNWWLGCQWYIDRGVAGIVTQNTRKDRTFTPGSIHSSGVSSSNDLYLIAQAARAARSARFEHEERERGFA